MTEKICLNFEFKQLLKLNSCLMVKGANRIDQCFLKAVGAGVIALSSIVIHRSSQYGDLFLKGILTLPILILIAGLIITLLGFFGCCGAMRENTCMLYTYAVIVSVLFICELALGILIALYPEKARDQIKDGMVEIFEKYGKDDQSLTRSIDTMQTDLQCCGVNNPEDWRSEFHHEIPNSCCIDKGDCNRNNPNEIYQKGCYEAIESSLKGVTMALGITAIVLGIIQMFL
ncbi:CD63 antigen [Armadillidium nasatum]|uniref:CD63 antigen n=1 Tax=Armadillidium nasatum TaxID=96803 RepID=A0A5N5TJX2_9CRUS|nr:CD63 antigen [Armadillidium nasatum]